MRRKLTVAMSLGLTGFALLVSLFLALYANANHPLPWVDWATYSNALQRLMDGGSPYDPRQLDGPYHLLDMSNGGAYGYEYPPASLLLFIPFAGQPIGLALWLTLNIGLLVSGIYAILRRELGRDAILSLGVASLPVLLWVGFAEGVKAGNVTVGLSGLLAWSWALGRERVPAVAVAVAGIAKVFPATLVFWTRPRRLLRDLGNAAVIAIAFCLVTLPIVGVQQWLDFLRAMSNVQPDCATFHYSPACLLEPAIGIGAAKLAALCMAGVMAIAAVFIRNDLAAFSMLAASWVVSTYNMSYYSALPLLVIWVVLFAVGMRKLRVHRAGRSAQAAAEPDGSAGPLLQTGQ